MLELLLILLHDKDQALSLVNSAHSFLLEPLSPGIQLTSINLVLASSFYVFITWLPLSLPWV